MSAQPTTSVPPDPSRPGWERWLLLVPPLVALVLHAGSLMHGFMGDDSFLILTNPQITTARPLSELLLTDWFNRGSVEAIGYYRPVVKATFRATYVLVGATPFAFHLTNLLLHAGAALLLALLLRRFVPTLAAAMGATLFAAHPATVQAVDIITARSDVLAAFFSLATCVAYARWTQERRAGWVALGAVCCALALGSKESALLMPVLLPVLARIRKVPLRAAALSLLPFAGVMALYAVLRGRLHIAPYPNALASLGWGGRLGAMLEALGSYVGPLLLGRDIVVLPALPTSVFDVGVLLGALVVVGGLGVLAWTRLRRPLALGLLLLGLGLVPALAVWMIHIPMWRENVPISERWLYLPSAGLGFCAALVFASLPRRTSVGLGVALGVMLGALTVMRTPAYASDEVYSRYVADIYRQAGPDALSPRERYLLLVADATEARQHGELERALALAEEGTRMAPGLPGGWWLLAEAAEQLGRTEQSVQAAEHLMSPEFLKGEAAMAERKAHQDDTLARLDGIAQHALLGRGYLRLGRLEDAEKETRRAAWLARGTADELPHLMVYAQVLEERGKLEQARQFYTQMAGTGWAEPELALARMDLKASQPERARQRLEGLVRRGGPVAERARELLASVPAP